MTNKKDTDALSCSICHQKSHRGLRMISLGFTKDLGEMEGRVNICEYCLRTMTKRLDLERFNSEVGTCSLCGSLSDALIAGPGEIKLCAGCVDTFQKVVDNNATEEHNFEYSLDPESPPAFWFDQDETPIKEKDKPECSVCNNTIGVTSFFPTKLGIMGLCKHCAETAINLMSRISNPPHRKGESCQHCGKKASERLKLLSFPGGSGLTLCLECLKLFNRAMEREPNFQAEDFQVVERDRKKLFTLVPAQEEPKKKAAVKKVNPKEGQSPIARVNIHVNLKETGKKEAPSKSKVRMCSFCRKNEGNIMPTIPISLQKIFPVEPWCLCESCLDNFHSYLRKPTKGLPADRNAVRCSLCSFPIYTGQKAIMGPLPERHVLCERCVKALSYIVKRYHQDLKP
ncbi:MAG: hypothetical protein LBE27_03055 [Deltaproteobacteria bacterium]|jgi:hypothetical protein|nr:hypothetical protein [Deltaproteobacteria bacterium]